MLFIRGLKVKRAVLRICDSYCEIPVKYETKAV